MGFLLAANDAHLDPELVAHRPHEFAAVLCFADRAGGHRLQCIGAVPIGDAFEGAQRFQAPIEMGGVMTPLRSASRAARAPWRGRGYRCARSRSRGRR